MRFRSYGHSGEKVGIRSEFLKKRVPYCVVASVVVLSVITVAPTRARAQISGAISVSSSSLSYECEMLDAAPQIRTVYVLHTLNAGTTASRFRLVAGAGMTMTWMSETHAFASSLGDTQSGLSVCYGSCTTGDVLIASVTYMAFGTSANCSELRVVPHPDASTIEAIQCDGVPIRTFGRNLRLSTGSPCGCPSSSAFPGTPANFTCEPVAVKASTWGAIKALYAN